MQSGMPLARCAIFVVLFCIFLPLFVSPAPIPPQSDQDALFNQAVDAYKQNQFTVAGEKFKQVSGSHAPEAKQYIGKIKTYTDAMQVAKSTLDRTADEMDVRSVQYAIEQLEVAIKVKPDGPWQPQQQLAKARQLKTELDKKHADSSKVADTRFCNEALSAAKENHYKEAKQFSCLLADDNPGYVCGGDEAVHLCETNTELAKLGNGNLEKTSSKAQTATAAPNSGALDKAKSAFQANEFDRARGLLQRIAGDEKPVADDLLAKIDRYNQSFGNGEKLSRGGQYEQARSAFLDAANIKPDGPGSPQTRASRMELLLGLDQFYSGDYVSAAQHLQSCAATETNKQSMVHFYLGASKLARFFVTGSGDSSLQREAIAELKIAKQAGYKPAEQDLSPKIRQVYDSLSN